MARKTPLWEDRFRVGMILGGLVLGLLLSVFLLPALFGRQIQSWIIPVVALSTLVIFVPLFFLARSFGDRVLVKDRIEVGMRATGTKKWRHGRITVTQGHFTFQPYLWQVRIPKGEPVELDVENMTEDTGRRPSMKQLWSVNPLLHVVEIDTSKGRFEIAGLPTHLKELRDRELGNVSA